MSTHRCEVFAVEEIREHPNAERLEILPIAGWQTVVGKGQYEVGDLVAFVPPESLCPAARPEFAFLESKVNRDGYARIRVAKLRGLISQGLVVPAPEGSKVGDDVMEQLGVKPYEPPISVSGRTRGFSGEAESPPPLLIPKYDLENWERYGRLLETNEAFLAVGRVIVSCKLHGTNWRVFFDGDRFWCGSRGEWKKEDPENLYWRVLFENPEVREYLKANPNRVLFGEIYGWVQDLRYGHQPGEVSYAFFDEMVGGRFIDAEEFHPRMKAFGLRSVPVVYEGPYDSAMIPELAEGRSLIADHVREGVVVKPARECYDARIGRLALKKVGDGFHLRNDKVAA